VGKWAFLEIIYQLWHNLYIFSRGLFFHACRDGNDHDDERLALARAALTVTQRPWGYIVKKNSDDLGTAGLSEHMAPALCPIRKRLQ